MKIDFLLYTPTNGWVASIDGQTQRIDGLGELTARMLNEAVNNLSDRAELLKTWTELKR